MSHDYGKVILRSGTAQTLRKHAKDQCLFFFAGYLFCSFFVLSYCHGDFQCCDTLLRQM